MSSEKYDLEQGTPQVTQREGFSSNGVPITSHTISRNDGAATGAPGATNGAGTTGVHGGGHHFSAFARGDITDSRTYHIRKFANPAPLGLFSFASTTLILSFINVQTRSVAIPNIVVGMALGTGGLVQLLAGMWEFAQGNTFGATAFSSYGGFWISYALIFIPGAGIEDSYEKTTELHNAVGFFLIAWFIFTFCMFLGSLRTTAALAALFFFLDMTFLLLAIGAFLDHVAVTKAGGVFGLITAFIAYYAAAANIITAEASYVRLPVIDLPKRND